MQKYVILTQNSPNDACVGATLPPFGAAQTPPPICFLRIYTEGGFILGDGVGSAPRSHCWAELPAQGTTFWQHGWGVRNACLEVLKGIKVREMRDSVGNLHITAAPT